MTEDPATSAPGTAWTAICPSCGAKLQPVARACWQCGAILHDAASEELDYRPTDPEAARGVSILILAAIGIACPILFYWWLLSIFG